MAAQVFKSSSREGSESARMMYLLSIAAARESILISASYFVPDDLSVATLVEARRRGVAVRIILPGPVMDVEVVAQGLARPLGRAALRPGSRSTSTSRPCTTAR